VRRTAGGRDLFLGVHNWFCLAQSSPVFRIDRQGLQEGKRMIGQRGIDERSLVFKASAAIQPKAPIQHQNRQIQEGFRFDNSFV
jgi:hypothetical protein